MALLFADTTYDIHLGLLSDDLRWMEFRSERGQKASAILQRQVYDLCSAHGLSVRELKGLVTCAGPGFYTGLRLSEGFADIFRFFNLSTHSFYSYDVPRFTGVESGAWVTKAYRGEYFFHTWKGDAGENKLVTDKELPTILAGLEHVYVHTPGAMDRDLQSFTSTMELLKAKPEVFAKILSAEPRESFYFRAPEDEFKVNP